MQKLYYDEYEIVKLLEEKRVNPKLARLSFEKYFEKYPKDFGSVPYYIKLLIDLKEFDKAKIVMDELKFNLKINPEFSNYEEKITKLKINLYLAKAFYLLFQEKYVECYKFLKYHIKFLNQNNVYVDYIYNYVKHKLNLPCKESDSYALNQLTNYSEEEFLKHMKKHLIIGDETEDEVKNPALFYPEFPFNEIFNELKKIVPNGKVFYYGVGQDSYFCKYDMCGKVGKREVDYFRVITAHGAPEFITMYPCLEGRNYDYLDFNYLRGYERVNQINKFNKKYHM